jgi:hypothetical protein
MIKTKRGGLAEFYIFLGSVMVLIIIFFVLFLMLQANKNEAERHVEERIDRLDREVLLLNYLRSPTEFLEGLNYADYISTSNYYLIESAAFPSYSDYEPENFDEFITSTKNYFNRAMWNTKISWVLTIKNIVGRNTQDYVRSNRLPEENTDVNSLRIEGEMDLPAHKIISNSKLVALQIIPGPDGRTHMIQLYEINLED